jgi:acetyl esterase
VADGYLDPPSFMSDDLRAHGSIRMSHPFVRPDVKALLDYLAEARGPQMGDVGHVEARQMARSMMGLMDADPGEIAVIRDIAGPVPLRLYDAREDRLPGPALVYFHGGGFVVGDLDTHEPVCAEIARVLDLPVISVDYRLAPEHPWPAGPDDCEAATRWIASSPAELGRSVASLILAGDSAGGALTIVTTLALRDNPAAVPVIVQWPIYPAADLGGRYASYDVYGEGYFLTRDGMTWFNQCYQPDFLHWRASPLRADQAGLPPTLVVTASLDPLVDQGRAYAAKCVEAGVTTVYREARGNIHGFLNMRRAIPSSQGDLLGCLNVLKAMIAEAEADRVMTEAAAGADAVPS